VRKGTPKLREEAYVCMFCGRAGQLDEFCFRRRRIERRHFDYVRNSYCDEFSDFLPRSFTGTLPRSSSHASPKFADTPNHHSYSFGSQRTTLSLDTFVMVHVLIVVIVSRVGLFFLLEGLTLTLS
jgi:hypothetical protein